MLITNETEGNYVSGCLLITLVVSGDNKKNMPYEVLARFELATICVLSRCDNHYTTEPLTAGHSRSFRNHE